MFSLGVSAAMGDEISTSVHIKHNTLIKNQNNSEARHPRYPAIANSFLCALFSETC